MRVQTVKATAGATLTNDVTAVDFDTPFLRGNECVLVVEATQDYNAGTLLIETDNDTDSTGAAVYSTIVNEVMDQSTATTYSAPLFYNITLGDNIRISTGTWVAGNITVRLLGDS